MKSMRPEADGSDDVGLSARQAPGSDRSVGLQRFVVVEERSGRLSGQVLVVGSKRAEG